MNVDTVNAIKGALQPIADKIGQGSAYVWETVVRQQIVYGCVGVFFTIIGIVLLMIAVKVCWPAFKAGKAWERDSEGAVLVLTIVAGTLALVAGSLSAITHFLNPAYYALDFFVGLVK